MTDTIRSIVVASFYRFVELSHLGAWREQLEARCREAGLKGTILLANEGINGTVAGNRQGVDALRRFLLGQTFFAPLEWKQSRSDEQPFYRMKVRVKKEIVTMGVPTVRTAVAVGSHVAAQDWNALVADPAVTVVDVRNRYEVHLGSFAGAVDPATDSFRDFPRWARHNLAKEQPVAMFCTGGIRCEKAAAYLKEQGFERVFQLHGGILRYLEQVPEQDSLWRGECFVFDNRVTVDHQLQPCHREICFNCRMPLSAQDQASSDYLKHVSCPHCVQRVDAARRASLLERKRQIELARARGQSHIGQRFEQLG